ncbi:hypothetical protein SS1G_06438 [Sclerotinia sclerotiorum 1980 UF-70]|uniref:Zn(2)-C6 fungal-type domain-containing protein n=2 Tax=Sclerotinia sclerotiorum (strain ATCC 18683 / 1980 / Ss-1) TaxID=665079 RepID=A7EM91_SCLS1|nr:hypothetical protein SS1G_06438 [Sclerotinia sclerotiorum 1980 UF-70]APA14509.1 hypothetical protein sscle_13g092790 [Sclerotinia sclerotiorum 1980 UF-70]EDO03957.1 hypothetical protein SS1G_06438 [Sclerotinia sclerotiorum 1980 UF-70]
MTTDLRKRKEQLRLARLVEGRGFEMPSYSLCDRQERKCIVSSTDSSRCAECIRQGKKCDVRGPSESDWDSLDRQKARLEQEEEEAMAKILRLRKQKRLLLERESDMLRRGLRTLDELVEVEEKERLENERMEREREQADTGPLVPAAASSNVLDNFDPSSFLSPSDPFSFQNSSGTFWGDPDSVGEMPSTSQGS